MASRSSANKTAVGSSESVVAEVHALLGGDAVKWLSHEWPEADFEWPRFWDSWQNEFVGGDGARGRKCNGAFTMAAVENSAPPMCSHISTSDRASCRALALSASMGHLSRAQTSSLWLRFARGLEREAPTCTARPPGD